MNQDQTLALARSAGLPPGVAQHWLWCVEEAGLIVLADNDIDPAARVIAHTSWYGWDHVNRANESVETLWDNLTDRAKDAYRDTARRAIAALRSSPPADFPAAGGAPAHVHDWKYDPEQQTWVCSGCPITAYPTAGAPKTHDGVQADKAVDPHDDLDGHRETIRGSSW